MFVKTLLVALAIVALASSVQGVNLLQGCLHTGDSLLYSKRVTIYPQNEQVVKTSVSYPNEESVGGDFIISAVIALDKSANGQGGYARIASGRIGMKKMTLDFVSLNATSGIDFDVQIFGMPYS